MNTEELKQVVKQSVKKMYTVSEYTNNQKVIKVFHDFAESIFDEYEGYLNGNGDNLEYIIADIRNFITLGSDEIEDWIDDIDFTFEDYKEYVYISFLVFKYALNNR